MTKERTLEDNLLIIKGEETSPGVIGETKGGKATSTA